MFWTSFARMFSSVLSSYVVQVYSGLSHEEQSNIWSAGSQEPRLKIQELLLRSLGSCSGKDLLIWNLLCCCQACGILCGWSHLTVLPDGVFPLHFFPDPYFEACVLAVECISCTPPPLFVNIKWLRLHAFTPFPATWNIPNPKKEIKHKILITSPRVMQLGMGVGSSATRWLWGVWKRLPNGHLPFHTHKRAVSLCFFNKLHRKTGLKESALLTRKSIWINPERPRKLIRTWEALQGEQQWTPWFPVLDVRDPGHKSVQSYHHHDLIPNFWLPNRQNPKAIDVGIWSQCTSQHLAPFIERDIGPLQTSH